MDANQFAILKPTLSLIDLDLASVYWRMSVWGRRTQFFFSSFPTRAGDDI